MPSAEISDRELRLLRLRAQGLLDEDRTDSVRAAVARALAVQAQDVGTGKLGLRARTTLTEAEASRQAARPAVCRSWLMRNTLFLFATRDLAWMRPALATRALVPAMRRLGQERVSEAEVERLLGVLRERLAEGPLPRPQARELLISEGLDPGENNQRIYWTFHAAALRGVIVVRPALEPVQTFVAGPAGDELSRERALGRLARRFLKGHGPATADDLAYWAKIPKADARFGWEHAGRTVAVLTERGPMTALPGTIDPPSAAAPVVRLLGEWDHFLLSWVDKGLAVPADQIEVRLVAGRKTAFADGLAFATWRLERGRNGIAVTVEPFSRMPRRARAGLEAEVADLGRFFEQPARLVVG